MMRCSFKMSGAVKKQKCSEIRYVEKFMTALEGKFFIEVGNRSIFKHE